MSESAGSKPPPEDLGDVPSPSSRASGPGALGRVLRDLWRRVVWWRNDEGEAALRDALEEFIGQPEAAQAPADADDHEMLVNLLNFHKLEAEDVMVPRVDIGAVDAATGLEQLVALLNRNYHSRLPVFRENLDDVIGMVHIKDVLAAHSKPHDFSLTDIVRPVSFVAPTMRVVDLLLQMQQTRNHMALVVDEYGGVDGLITIEDLVEEIVGEIEDEFDVVEGPRLVIQPDQTLQADARATIEEFEELVGPVLSDDERDDVDTLGGLVFALAGRVPSRGDLVTHPSGVEFEVLAADRRRIKHLRVRNLPRLSTQPPNHP